MSSQTVRLSSDELWTALDDIDPVGVLLDELRTVPAQLPRMAEDLAVRTHPVTGARCLLPSACLRDIRTAALAALAARHLVASRVVTAAVLGWGAGAALRLAVLVRCVPDITHVAVCPGAGVDIGPRTRDQLDLAGIGLSVVTRLSEAVRGANLVDVLDPELCGGRLGPLANGAVVVNSVGGALPDSVVAGVDQIFVDDRGLLPAGRRYVLAGDRGTVRTRRRGDRDRPWRIEADLTQVAAGTHPGRARLDDVLLVDLLGTDVGSAVLADRLLRSAARRGLGARDAG